MNNHDYVEASYVINNLRAVLRRSVADGAASQSLTHRINNIQDFLDYLNEEGLG